MAINLLSWNVNGIRSVSRKGFLNWFEKQSADVVCVQEIKAHPDQLEDALKNPLGYHALWYPAEKSGYSGTAIFVKREEPVAVRYGFGHTEFDGEGRLLVAEFKNYTLINTYFPNSQRDHKRLPFKLKFCQKVATVCQVERERGKTVVLCGDFNIAHQEIDLKNPRSNMNNAGFLPEERAWMSEFLLSGYVDAFRHLCPDPGHYTWWSYRPLVRARNIGWRLDYFLLDKESCGRIKLAEHQPEIMGSDHCPVMLRLQD